MAHEYQIYIAHKILSAWAQCLILDLVSKYVPSKNNEIFNIMNLLEDRLQHVNSVFILAKINVFLHLTISMVDVHQKVSFENEFNVNNVLFIKHLRMENLTAILVIFVWYSNFGWLLPHNRNLDA